MPEKIDRNQRTDFSASVPQTIKNILGVKEAQEKKLKNQSKTDGEENNISNPRPEQSSTEVNIRA